VSVYNPIIHVAVGNEKTGDLRANIEYNEFAVYVIKRIIAAQADF
jgi:hypothetical protein